MSFNIEKILGKEANYLLDHKCNTVKKEHLHLPGPDFVDRVMTSSDRNPVVLRNMQTLFNNGRMGGTGYVSILPVDQGIEHTAGASFAPNPIYFDPEKIVELAIEGVVMRLLPLLVFLVLFQESTHIRFHFSLN